MVNKQSGELNGVMYALFHLKDLEEARSNRYMYNIYDQFTQKFDSAAQEKTINAIERALENGNIDEFCTLPGIPGSNEFKKEYLEIVLKHLKNAMI
jgi:hypothetical protein